LTAFCSLHGSHFLLTQVQTGLSAAERIFALIDAEHTVIQTETHPHTGAWENRL
jgi:ABC-type multidrug transport system fused ATPase/permease subunit